MKCGECHEHDRGREKPQGGGSRLKERGRESLPQMVLICQLVDTRLKGDDRDALGTIKLTVKDPRRILIHGKHFPFLTPGKREQGGADHLETRMCETCDMTVWVTTRDLVFPVTRDRYIVTSARDTVKGSQTNFVISPEILRFCNQVLKQWEPGNEPTQCMKVVRELVDQ